MISRVAHCICAHCRAVFRIASRDLVDRQSTLPRYRRISYVRNVQQASRSYLAASKSDGSLPQSDGERRPGSTNASDTVRLGRYSRTPIDSRSLLQNVVYSSRSSESQKPPEQSEDRAANLSQDSNAVAQGLSDGDASVANQPATTPADEPLQVRAARAYSESTSTVKRPSRRTTNRIVVVASGDTDQSPQKLFEATVERQLGRAIERHNVRLVEKAYHDIVAFQQSNPGVSLSLSVYENMIHSCMDLRVADLAMQTWDLMQASGIKPSVKTWTIMIRGCSKNSEPRAVHVFWNGLRDSGQAPDATAWSARIFALIETRQPDRAFDALIEMRDEWRAFQRLKTTGAEDVAPVAEPDIAVANAAITAYSSGRQNYESYVPRVLRWAGELGLAPNTVTYNTLINMAMRKDDVEQAFQVLQRMREEGVKADSSTLTIMLTKVFWSDLLDKTRGQEQTKHLLDMINDLETNQIKAKLDEKGYALAVDRMLKYYGNEHAAHALLARMRSQGIKPTPHIYTVLLTHHLRSDPPNYAAVENLWTDITFANKGYGATLDAVFCDRALELFSPHHSVLGTSRIDEMLSYMARQGKRPSWVALLAVAKVYAERRDMDRLLKLVDDVRFSRSFVSSGVSKGYGREDFWQYINSTGLLKEQSGQSRQRTPRDFHEP